MSNAKTIDPLDRKFTLETLQGKGVRGKYFAKIAKGSNVVKLNPDFAKVFPTSDTVDAAPISVIEDFELTKTRRSTQRKAA